MSYLVLTGVTRKIAVTVYNFVAGTAEWLLDFSDENNSFYAGLF